MSLMLVFALASTTLCAAQEEVSKETAQPSHQLSDGNLILSASLDKKIAYAGEQVIYALKIMRRVELRNTSLTELDIESAVVTPLEDRKYQQQIDGENYQIIEKRYALHFIATGQQSIRGQILSTGIRDPGQPDLGWRFNDHSKGKLIQLTAKPLNIEVQPIPPELQQLPYLPFLPASSIELQENGQPDQQAIVGEPFTRTIETRVQGLHPEQLPTPTLTEMEGLNSYPEKPQFVVQPWQGGIAGMRVDNVVIIPTQPGEVTLPAIEIAWWNTEARRSQTTILPARNLTVLDTPLASNQPVPSTTIGDTASDPETAKQSAPVSKSRSLPVIWLMLFAVSLVVIGVFTARYRKERLTSLPSASQKKTTVRSNLRTFATLSKRLKAARIKLFIHCDENNALAARPAFNEWLVRYAEYENHSFRRGFGLPFSYPLQPVDILSHLGNEKLNQANKALNKWLYQKDVAGKPWQGDQLKKVVDSIKPSGFFTQLYKKPRKKHPGLPPLYPAQRGGNRPRGQT